MILPRTVAQTSIVLTLAIAAVTAAVVLARGGGAAPAAAWAVVVVLVTRVGPILASFVVAWWPRPGHRVPPLGLAGTLRTFFAEAWATMRLFFFYHPFERLVTRRAPERVAPGETPILFVHGFYSNAAFWQAMKPALRAAGWRNLFSMNLEPLLENIEEYARQLDEEVDAVRARCGTDSVVVVAHSMGGLVARACERRRPGRIRHLVCLGTPHQGTLLASLVWSTTTRQMRPGSDWLNELNDRQPEVAMTNLYSEHDNIIVPQTSATLPGTDGIALRGIGHLEMAFSSVLQQALIDALEPVLPTPQLDKSS